MLTAEKSRWIEKLFAVYNRNLLKRRFNSLRVCGLEYLTAKNSQMPLIIYANHSSWWDGIVAYEISQAANLDFFVMMEEKQLKNLFLFRKLGAFSVVRENLRSAIESLHYAANLLKTDSRRTLWIFPQGEILPNDTRPLRFYRGFAKIAEKVGRCSMMAVSMRYEFLGSYKPDVFVKISRMQEFEINSQKNSRSIAAQAADQTSQNLDFLKSEIAANDLENYKNII